jgi:hypothetical protein
MRVRSIAAVLAAAGLLEAALVGVLPLAAEAQLVTCRPGTATVARAVGSPTAPMLVPMQVPVNVCSQNGQVVGVVPAFQAVGPQQSPMIVPTQLLTRTCAPTVVSTTPALGGGISAPLQFAQVAAGTTVVSIVGGGFTTLPVVPGTPATLAATPVLTTTPITAAPSVVTGSFFTVPTAVVTTTPTAFTCF